MHMSSSPVIAAPDHDTLSDTGRTAHLRTPEAVILVGLRLTAAGSSAAAEYWKRCGLQQGMNAADALVQVLAAGAADWAFNGVMSPDLTADEKRVLAAIAALQQARPLEMFDALSGALSGAAVRIALPLCQDLADTARGAGLVLPDRRWRLPGPFTAGRTLRPPACCGRGVRYALH